MDCIFCKIADGTIPANIVYENETVIAFRDLQPQAPDHILIIPKKHIPTINDFAAEDWAIFAAMGSAAKEVAGAISVAEKGYRLVINCNNEGGQTVFHTHMHFLSGRQMTWPPG